MERLIEIAVGNAGFAAVLAVAAAVASRFVRRPAVVHAVWVLVLLRLLAPPILELGMLPPPAVQPAAENVTIPAAPVEVTDRPAPLPAPVPAQGMFVFLWLAGTALVLTIAVSRTARLRVLLAAAEQPSAALRTTVAELAERLGVRRVPRIDVIRAQVPPMLWGTFAGLRLILPVALLERLEERERDTLIAHELAHLRRRDHWVRHLELATMLLFWWHPVAWWARSRLRMAEELCCDAIVARSLPGHARAYADCLVKTMHYLADRRTRAFAAACGMASMQEMKGRLTMIMTRSLPKALSHPARLALLLAAVALLAVSPTLTARTGTAGLEGRITASVDTISVEFEDAAILDALRELSKVARLNLVIHPLALADNLLSGTVSVRLSESRWEPVLNQILAGRGLSWTREGKLIWVHPGGTVLSGDRDFNGEPITLSLKDARVVDVLDTFARLTSLDISVDPEVDTTVTVSFHEVPWDQALDLILTISGLGYDFDPEAGTLDAHPVSHTSGVMLSPGDSPGDAIARARERKAKTSVVAEDDQQGD
jgi:beta-lactamase regulating signal transducer with metallopeptidase domain